MNTDLALLVLRVAVGVVIMGHGLLKIGWVGKGGTLVGTAGWFGSIGLKPGMFWAAIAALAEAGGGFLPIPRLGRPRGPGDAATGVLVRPPRAPPPKRG